MTETLARAVHHAHARGVVHRDPKPANVLLTAEGTPKIGDFGLAKLLDTESGQTHTEQVMGTPPYMAPEQAAGQSRDAGPAVDVYALGAILYEMLTGRPPFRGANNLETLEQVRTLDPVPPSQLQPKTPRDLETVCLKCLRKAPAQGYATAAELADDLHRFLDGVPIRARRVGALPRLGRWCRRNLALAAAGAVTAAALLTVLVLLGIFGVVQAEHAASLQGALTREREALAGKGRWTTDSFGSPGRCKRRRVKTLLSRTGFALNWLTGGAIVTRSLTSWNTRPRC